MRVVRFIVLAAAALASACGSRAAAGAPDDSYNQIEELRAARAVAADHRYDPIEELRAARAIAADHRYDPIEELRATRQASLSGSVSDDSYDKVEATRLNRFK